MIAIPHAIVSAAPEPDTTPQCLGELRARVETLEKELEGEQLLRAGVCEELRVAREQFQAILDAVPGGVSWINADLEYLGINERLARTFGLAPSEFIGHQIGFLHASSEFESFVREFLASPARAESRELDMSVKAERRCYLMMAQKYGEGESAFFIGIDISDRKQAEEKLRREAFFDALTGLPNRALLLDRLRHALDFSQRRPEYLFAVLFLDFDGFKTVNDSLGHAVGDRILTALARRLETLVRTSDTVSRIGGDEYVVLLDPIEGLSDATHIAERIRRATAVPFCFDGQDIFLTVSIGIVLNAASYGNPDELLRDADIAMYRAKTGGRNRYEIFDMTMHGAAMARLQLETDLHLSLESNDFLLHYQPILELGTGKIHAFEALVRWQRPRSGFTTPHEFIPTAEETGLIVRLDRWVLREACRQMRAWIDELDERCPQSVSVNLSSRQFSYPDLVEFVEGVLTQTGLDASRLTIEITESAIMENVEGAAISLRGLQRLGVKIGLDDFGTGYSSLSYIHKLPLQTLKIDRSFMLEAAREESSRAVVSAIVALSHNLGMKVVAEGVETCAQLEMLMLLNCEFAQGFLFHGPLTADDARAVLVGQ